MVSWPASPLCLETRQGSAIFVFRGRDGSVASPAGAHAHARPRVSRPLPASPETGGQPPPRGKVALLTATRPFQLTNCTRGQISRGVISKMMRKYVSNSRTISAPLNEHTNSIQCAGRGRKSKSLTPLGNFANVCETSLDGGHPSAGKRLQESSSENALSPLSPCHQLYLLLLVLGTWALLRMVFKSGRWLDEGLRPLLSE